MIPPPTVLATLPHHSAVENEAIHAAPVHSLGLVADSTDEDGTETRKHLRRGRRAEIAVTCPGGGVHIYNVGIGPM